MTGTPPYRIPMPAAHARTLELAESGADIRWGLNRTHLAMRFRGSFNNDAWERALGSVRERHQVLKARIFREHGGFDYIIEEPYSSFLENYAFEPPPDADLEICLRDFIGDLVWQPFDLHRGSLARAFVVRVSESDHVLGMVVNHLVADAQSMALLARELLALYYSNATGRPLNLPLPAVQYLDHIESTRQWLQSSEAIAQRAYWIEKLQGAEDLHLPYLQTDPEAQVEASTHRFCLEGDLFTAVLSYARTLRTTPFILLLTAKMVTLSLLTRMSDITVSVPKEQRGLSLQNTIGFFVYLMPIRINVRLTETFASVAAAVSATYREACLHERALDQLTAPNGRVMPAFQFVNVGGRHFRTNAQLGFGAFSVPEPPATRLSLRQSPAHSLLIQQREDCMDAELVYLPNAYGVETIHAFVTCFRNVLSFGVHAPNHALCNARIA